MDGVAPIFVEGTSTIPTGSEETCAAGEGDEEAGAEGDAAGNGNGEPGEKAALLNWPV